MRKAFRRAANPEVESVKYEPTSTPELVSFEAKVALSRTDRDDPVLVKSIPRSLRRETLPVSPLPAPNMMERNFAEIAFTSLFPAKVPDVTVVPFTVILV